MNATLCPIMMDVLLKNQPEGVQLSVKDVSSNHSLTFYQNQDHLTLGIVL